MTDWFKCLFKNPYCHELLKSPFAMFPLIVAVQGQLKKVILWQLGPNGIPFILIFISSFDLLHCLILHQFLTNWLFFNTTLGLAQWSGCLECLDPTQLHFNYIPSLHAYVTILLKTLVHLNSYRVACLMMHLCQHLCRQNTFFNNVHNDKILLLMAVDQKFNRLCYNWKS